MEIMFKSLVSLIVIAGLAYFWMLPLDVTGTFESYLGKYVKLRKEGSIQEARAAPSDTLGSSAPADTSAVGTPSIWRGPTFEVTKNSKVDATAAVIPGDLPFQFAKVDDGSILDMPGTVITREANGSIRVMPGAVPVNRAFPAPTGEFFGFSNDQLRSAASSIAVNLREFQKRFEAENRFLPRLPPPRYGVEDSIFKAFAEKYRSEYINTLLDPSLSIASEMFGRIEAAAPGTKFQNSGAMLLYHRAFAGPRAALEVAEFLDALSAKLPN